MKTVRVDLALYSQQTAADHGMQDNFLQDNTYGGAERRLHLLAFDYWFTLKADRDFPLFSELRAEDLKPFRDKSLLLEFKKNTAVVRFIGSEINDVLDAPLTVGCNLADFSQSAFATALLDQFSSEDARIKAAEFEFEEATMKCRGTMLPFSSDGSAPHFIMVVVGFQAQNHMQDPEGEQDPGHSQDLVDTQDPSDAQDFGDAQDLGDAQNLVPSADTDTEQTPQQPEEAPAENTSGAGTATDDAPPPPNLNALNGLLNAGQRAADSIVHMDNGNRASLYNALASALALYEGAQENPDAYTAVLENAHLKAQVRAPFTPVLKLVFGAQYDKTRLTEYAAALSFALRHGETSMSVATFLRSFPGGIKGCVQEERAYKRGTGGTAAQIRQQQAAKAVQNMPAKQLTDIFFETDFCLILARRNADGSIDLVEQADTPLTTLDAAVRHLATRQNKTEN